VQSALLLEHTLLIADDPTLLLKMDLLFSGRLEHVGVDALSYSTDTATKPLLAISCTMS